MQPNLKATKHLLKLPVVHRKLWKSTKTAVQQDGEAIHLPQRG